MKGEKKMSNKLYYVCKYTPIELLEALGADCASLNEMPEGFEPVSYTHLTLPTNSLV